MQQLVVEVKLASPTSGSPNGGWGNYSTCELGAGRSQYSCSCGLGCDCGCDCGSGGECGCDCAGLANTVGRCPSHGFATQGTSPPFGDWHSLFAQKGKGRAHWYSLLRAGGCAPGRPADDCMWRVAEHRAATNLSCHTDAVDALVEARGPMKQCLARCPDPKRGDDCWTGCYMSELLGANATTPDTGMTADEITQLWLRPFATCPNLFHARRRTDDGDEGAAAVWAPAPALAPAPAPRRT